MRLAKKVSKIDDNKRVADFSQSKDDSIISDSSYSSFSDGEI